MIYEGMMKQADFSYSWAAGVEFVGMNLNWVNLNGAFFKGANLSGADFASADMRNCDFKDSWAYGGQRTCFAYAYCEGINFASSNLENVVFFNADLQDANFTSARLDQVQFECAILDGSRFEDVKLTDSSFKGASLPAPLLFRGARVNNIDLDSSSTEEPMWLEQFSSVIHKESLFDIHQWELVEVEFEGSKLTYYKIRRKQAK